MIFSRLSAILALRVLVFGLLCVALALILIYTQRYVTSLFVAALAAWVLVSIVHTVGGADRMLARFIDSVTTSEFDLSNPEVNRRAGFESLARAINHGTRKLSERKAADRAALDHARAFIDNLSAALFERGDDGSLKPINRAARKFFPGSDPQAHAEILQLAPGQRAVVRFNNGQRVLASLGEIQTAARRTGLLSLENIEGELVAVEIKAWQDLVRVLTHEIMSSLTPIASLTESLQRIVRGSETPAGEALSGLDRGTKSKTTQIAAALDTIGRRSTGLMSFVSRYRQVANLPRPNLRSVTLAELVDRLDRLMGPSIAQHQLNYTSHVEPTTLCARADAELLEQALINLLRNAIDATAEIANGQVQLRCEARADNLVITVTDNGCGVPSEVLDKIFVPFFTTKPGGSGIGLSLAMQIARAHHGTIEVTTQNSRGSVFVYVMPLNSGG